ncbi:SipW-dependent-type signal peptide-containing protein [Caloramator sp. CAR-1]|uniref:SipW-dependent-type signal peptide-containing protein n=1 Tax=Caloramator sp. CAR-1 TaxID=3062777 RepID=UPI0026E28465|nr:SipW-dependent-type signal peptide-containing protein [Caloramator sp. CAR-1]MDO6354986.1 SipW-dependent-type signal peptide-containing protein [Caloramator sp. CAR-1]
MKKSRFISIVLVMVFLIIGAGYAYWTDTVTFGTTVKTGNVDIAFESDPQMEDLDEYVETKVTAIDNNNVNIKIDKLYPGGGDGVSFRLVNSGTIPVVFDNVNVSTINDDKSMISNNVLTFSVELCKVKNNGEYINPFKNSPILYNLDQVCNLINYRLRNWNGQNNPLILNPGEALEIRNPEALQAGYFVSMSPNAGDQYENATLSFNLNFQFKQWNAQ